METEAAGQSPVERMVGRPVLRRASACGLTECLRKPMCVRCASMAEMDALCGLLPDGVHWGDPLTPELLRQLLADKLAPAFAWKSRDPGCWCARCDMEHNVLRTRMSVCNKCGDKRCPRADDHRNECRKPPNI